MLRTRHVLAMTVLLGTLFALAACSSGTSAPSSGGTSGGTSGGNTVTLQNVAFNPASLSVKAGDTVTFKNADQVPHNIVVGTDDLGIQQPGESKTWKAPKDGTYVMKCLIHPSMQGQITVGAGGATVGTLPAGGGAGTPGY